MCSHYIMISNPPHNQNTPTTQNAAIDLLAEIGTVHMTVPHLHWLLRMLQPRTDGNDDANATAVARRPANLSRLLRCLDRMVEEERFAGPSHYLWLDGGPQSGLHLRPLAGFSRRHYSFVTWVCLEAGVADPSSSYKPYLFSLVAEDGTALDAYFTPTGGGGGGGGGGGQQGHYALQLEYRRNKVGGGWGVGVCMARSFHRRDVVLNLTVVFDLTGLAGVCRVERHGSGRRRWGERRADDRGGPLVSSSSVGLLHALYPATSPD